MVTHTAAALRGLGAGLWTPPGARADMVIADGEDDKRLVGGGQDKMIVVSKGRPIGENAAARAGF
jgi:hypothetical protein